jgi:hypothetical protein
MKLTHLNSITISVFNEVGNLLLSDEVFKMDVER